MAATSRTEAISDGERAQIEAALERFVFKAGAIVAADVAHLGAGFVGINTTDGNAYFKYPDGSLKYVALTTPA